jgi:SAM-dependent methyltransferase
MDHVAPLYEQLGTQSIMDLGFQLQSAERQVLSTLFADCCGDYAVQLGAHAGVAWFHEAKFRRAFIVHTEQAPKVNLIANFDELPFPEGSVDVLFLPHVLEFFKNPQPILAEAARILAPSGKLIVLDFNPAGLWGLTRLLRKLLFPVATKLPWSLHFHRRRKLLQYLQEADLFVQIQADAFYRPPFTRSNLLNRCSVLEVLGRFSWPEWGASYFLVVTKKVIPIIMKRVDFKEKELVTSGALNPVAQRNLHE